MLINKNLIFSIIFLQHASREKNITDPVIIVSSSIIIAISY